MRKLQAFFHSVKPKRILDVATGNGAFIQLVSKLYDGYEEIVALDRSSKAIESAKNTLSDPRITYIEKDVFDVEEGSFDVIMISNSLHHFNDVDALFDQLEGLLTRGGYIVINEMMSDGLSKAQKSHKMIHHFAAEIDRHFGKVHEETMTSKEILSIMQHSSKKKIIDAWDMAYPVEQEMAEKELDNVMQTIDRMLDKLEDDDFKQEMTIKANKMKKYIHKKGFQLATQMLIVLGENA